MSSRLEEGQGRWVPPLEMKVSLLPHWGQGAQKQPPRMGETGSGGGTKTISKL